MKILIGIDGSELCLRAIRFLTRFTSPHRDQFSLFFAPPRRPGAVDELPDGPSTDVILAEYIDQVFAAAEAELPPGYVRTRQLPAQETSPSQGLLDTAKQIGSQLTVVGIGQSSHRLPLFVGGVARHVVHESNCPVLAYRDQADDNEPLRILLAANPLEPMDTMVDLLHQICWPTDSIGYLMHITDYIEDERLRNWLQASPSDSARIWSQAMDQDVARERRRAQAELMMLQQRLPALFASQEPILAVGHVVPQVVDVAIDKQINLVIVGGRRRGPVTRLLGSTTEGLLLQSPTSILVVHELET